MRPPRLLRIAAPALTIALTTATPAAAYSPPATWQKCSVDQGAKAARAAGLASALDRDPVLHGIFAPQTEPSRVYRRPSMSLCADLDRDGRLERAVQYQCCTVSSPAPWVVLSRPGARWRIAYKRLHDTTWQLLADGSDLVTVEPKYDFRHDALCCPSHLRIGTLKWTGDGFRRIFRITGPDADPIEQQPKPAPAEEDPLPTETQPPPG